MPPAPDRVQPGPAVQRLRAGSIGLLLALVALGIGWEAWWTPTGRGALALKVLPLALALPGLVRHSLATYRWLSLLVWLYVLEGLVRVPGDKGLSASLAGAEVVLALALFGAVTLYIRRRLATPALRA